MVDTPQGQTNPDSRGPREDPNAAPSSTERARAGTLANKASTVVQGTLIPAVLETAFDSTRPGFARALVQRDIRGFDGSQVLIPRGSRLIGEYAADAAPGQKRAKVAWSRLIRPDGVTIAIGSPAADPVGRGGIKAKVNSHFLARFAGAILQSSLDVGVNLASRAGGAPVIVALPNSVQNTGVGNLRANQIQPTLTVPPRHQHLGVRRARSRLHRRGAGAVNALPVAKGPVRDRVYLTSYLAPLADMLARADVTDIYVNRPGEIWLETLSGTIERHEVTALDEALLTRLARQVAALTHQGISREHPLLSATLPDGSRIQVIAPPATDGAMAIAIRKHVSAGLSLDDYVAGGAFADTGTHADKDRQSIDAAIAGLIATGDIAGGLGAAVRARRNILVSGGTSTGKTTFLNALIREIPAYERLITIEDTPELQIDHSNRVALLAVRGQLGEAQVSADDLVSASLRMRPDRIILGELRGPEAYAFLRAVNTGHPGSMTTVHADSSDGAVEQIVLLILQGGTKLSRGDVQDYVRSTIGVYVQLDRTAGKRRIAEVRCT